jgi:hypothetical protein
VNGRRSGSLELLSWVFFLLGCMYLVQKGVDALVFHAPASADEGFVVIAALLSAVFLRLVILAEKKP